MKAQLRLQLQQASYNVAPLQFYTGGPGGYTAAAAGPPVLSHPMQPMLSQLVHHQVQPFQVQPIISQGKLPVLTITFIYGVLSSKFNFLIAQHSLQYQHGIVTNFPHGRC